VPVAGAPPHAGRVPGSFEETTVANQNPQRIAPPIPFLTAVWAGMSHEDILAGLRNGDIMRPGALPDWAAELDDPAAAMASNDGAAANALDVDRARVNGWFKSLDPQLSPSTFEAIWNKAGATDGERATKLTSRLSSLLLREDAGGNDAAAGLDADLARHARDATIVDLNGKTGDELAALAKTDIGYRYALAHLDSFAVIGDRRLFSDANADGSLNLFDGETGDALASDAWLADRGKFLAWKLCQDSGQSMAVSGHEDWTFVDRGIKGADGKPLTLEIKTGAANAGQNQVLFGTAEDEVFKGRSGSDRIYAGAGDDVLRGGRGGDHLEGGDGDDLAMGGAGNDELLGGRGDDELDGGRGNDRLEGGKGNDTYVIDAGDGADTIVDSDGIGTIELNGDALGGTMQRSDGKWLSADGNVEFTYSSDPNTGGRLTISTFADGANHDGQPQNTITVNDWKNGDLGITLGSDSENGGNQGENTETSAGSETSGQTTANVTSDTWEDQGALFLEGSGSVTNGAASEGPMVVASDGDAVQVPSQAGGEGAPDMNFDFDAAIESLLGNTNPTFAAVDPANFEQAIQAFSGVLEPPDVSGAGYLGATSEAGAVTEAAMADALAGDYASDAIDGFEPTHAQAIPSIDVASLMEMKQAGLEVRDRPGR
jgi:Ca2+-binding RTX toxin-like protein